MDTIVLTHRAYNGLIEKGHRVSTSSIICKSISVSFQSLAMLVLCSIGINQ